MTGWSFTAPPLMKCTCKMEGRNDMAEEKQTALSIKNVTKIYGKKKAADHVTFDIYPGEIFGFRQHGLPQLKLADPAKHLNIAQKAGAEASKLLENDPKLERKENCMLGERIRADFLKNDSLTL